jgi:hypothetical protein
MVFLEKVHGLGLASGSFLQLLCPIMLAQILLVKYGICMSCQETMTGSRHNSSSKQAPWCSIFSLHHRFAGPFLSS